MSAPDVADSDYGDASLTLDSGDVVAADPIRPPNRQLLVFLAVGAIVAIGIAILDLAESPANVAERIIPVGLVVLGLAGLALIGSAWIDLRQAISQLSTTASVVRAEARRFGAETADERGGRSHAEGMRRARALLAAGERQRESLIAAGAVDEAEVLTEALYSLRVELDRRGGARA